MCVTMCCESRKMSDVVVSPSRVVVLPKTELKYMLLIRYGTHWLPYVGLLNNPAEAVDILLRFSYVDYRVFEVELPAGDLIKSMLPV